MALKNRVLLAGTIVVLGCVLAILFSPLLVSGGLRLWIWWKARQQNAVVKIDNIDAPLFRPVTLRGIRIETARDAAFRVDATATRATINLDLQGILLRIRARPIQVLSVEDLHAEIHQNDAGSAISESGWNTLQKLLPNNCSFERLNLRLESGSSVILLRNISLTASQIEAGRFHADEIMIASTFFRQTFRNLRGATNWQNDRLTIAGLTLTRGLDVQSISGDFSRLSKRRAALDFDLDAFGGKIRGSISSEWRSHHSNWTMAASAADLSLSQTAEAVGFTDRVGGLLHAGKFTFRGDLRDPLAATASFWTELTGPAWRDRGADVIMLGMAFYNRQMQVQQLYVKQKKNQLTLSGEGSFPTAPAGWLHPDFRGNISASINDLGDFASLFGGRRSDFAGQIAIEGVMNARDRNIEGEVSANGSALTMFKTSIDLFNAELNIKQGALDIERFELKRKNDQLRLSGKVDLAASHAYSGQLDLTLSNISDYLSMLCGNIDARRTSADIHASISAGLWQAHGTIDPLESHPVNFSATFSLPFGSDWNSFLSSPANLSVDFPVLYLSEIPGCFTSPLWQNGTLSGNLSIDATPRHPHIIGNMLFSGVELPTAPTNINKINGRVIFDGYKGTIEFLNTATKDTTCSFFGEVDFDDLNNLAVRLFPTSPVFQLTSAPIDCLGRVDLVPIMESIAPIITGIELRGGISRTDWAIALREPALGSAVALPWDLTANEFVLCPDPANRAKVSVLGVSQPPKPEPVRPPRKRKR